MKRYAVYIFIFVVALHGAYAETVLPVLPAKLVAPFSKEDLTKAERNLEIRRLSAALDGALLLERRFQVAPLLEDLKKIAPESAPYFYYSGQETFVRGEHLTALGYFRKALRADTGFTPAYNMAGLVLLDAGRDLEASGMFEKAVEQSPYDPTYLMNLAMAQIRRGQKTQALGTLSRALDAKANFALAAYWAATLLQEQGQTEAAYALMDRSVRYGNPDPSAYLALLKLCETLSNEERIGEILIEMTDNKDAARLRIAGDWSYRYGEIERASSIYSRLVRMAEATREDRRRYIEILNGTDENPANWIRSAHLEEMERQDLLSFLREIQQRQSNPTARDPVTRPTR